MNKQELYDKINQLPSDLGWQGHGAKVMVAKDSVLELVRQLGEPQKVVVPKFMAEWIEKNNEIDGITYMLHLPIAPSRIVAWIDSDRNNARILARAWLDGYTIEQEKLYTVEIPNPRRKGNNRFFLLRDPNTGGVLLCKGNFNENKNQNLWLTESEIRKDFEWAWQAGFAKEVKDANL